MSEISKQKQKFLVFCISECSLSYLKTVQKIESAQRFTIFLAIQFVIFYKICTFATTT